MTVEAAETALRQLDQFGVHAGGVEVQQIVGWETAAGLSHQLAPAGGKRWRGFPPYGPAKE
ncbi:hypothetical protein GCM10027514_05610 [Azotobacter armeniacus]